MHTISHRQRLSKHISSVSPLSLKSLTTVCYHHLQYVVNTTYKKDATNVGDEGGFAPNIQENKEGLELLKTAIAKAGYTRKINSKLHVVIGMDVAASVFHDDKSKTYDLNIKEENKDGSEKISGDSLKNVYKSFVGGYPIVSIDDPFDQDDWVVYADGSICLDILQNQWSPIYDVPAILTSIQSLLCDPNPNSPANSEAARLLSENKRKYNRKVREIVEQSWTTD
ncbi:unnamed protein product [Lactuca virosa]|uniref:phosphopyruvate hydratase n=1 Tax=Lactuca virosa TaxID=75947 RepID=A0AAU9LTH3_9ASTR|nr:unnamed protein product [Lactuca virosa]